jgi:hypothetical protein
MKSPVAVPTLRPDLAEFSRDHNLQYGLGTLIGQLVMPEATVDKATAEFWTLNNSNARRRHILKHQSGAGFTRTTIDASSGLYDCEDYGLEIPADMKRRSKLSSPIDWESEDAAVIDYIVRLDHEVRVASSVMDPVTFTAHNVAVSWASRTTMTPKADIDASYNRMRQKAGVPKSQMTLIIDYTNWENLKGCSEIADLLKYTTPAIALGGDDAKRALIAQYLEIKQILVGQASYISSPSGAAATAYADVWSTRYGMLTHVAPGSGASKLYPCFGRTIRWTERMPSFVTFDTYYESNIDINVTRGRQFTDEFVLASDGIMADLLDLTAAT